MPGRDDGEIGRLRFRNADEAVNDAPHRAEQADEGRGRADGGQNAHAAPHGRCSARTISAKREPARSSVPTFGADRQRQFLLLFRRIEERAEDRAAGGPRPPATLRASATEAETATGAALARAISSVLATKTVQVAGDANAGPIMTAFTIMSADMNIDQGDGSCGIAFMASGTASSALAAVTRKTNETPRE